MKMERTFRQKFSSTLSAKHKRSGRAQNIWNLVHKREKELQIFTLKNVKALILSHLQLHTYEILFGTSSRSLQYPISYKAYTKVLAIMKIGPLNIGKVCQLPSHTRPELPKMSWNLKLDVIVIYMGYYSMELMCANLTETLPQHHL